MQFTSDKLSLAVIDALKLSRVIQQDSEYQLVGAPQLKRKDYEQFMQVVSALKGVWYKQRHRFAYDPSLKLAEVLEEGKVPQSNPLAFFPTSKDVCESIVIVGDLDDYFPDDLTMLEPSAGDGAIASYFRDHFGHTGLMIDCVELDESNRELLEQQGFSLVGRNFLEDEINKQYDLIVMNPPFKGSEYLKHIKKAYDLLNVGGQLLSVVPSSILFVSSALADEVRSLVGATGCYKPLEKGSFSHLGTDVDTAVIQIQKLHKTEWDRLHSKANGYPSVFCEAVMIALSCDRDFIEARRSVGTVQKLKQLVDNAIRRIQKDQVCCFYWTDEVISQVVSEQIDELAEDEIFLEGVKPQQLSLI